MRVNYLAPVLPKAGVALLGLLIRRLGLVDSIGVYEENREARSLKKLMSICQNIGCGGSDKILQSDSL